MTGTEFFRNESSLVLIEQDVIRVFSHNGGCFTISYGIETTDCVRVGVIKATTISGTEETTQTLQISSPEHARTIFEGICSQYRADGSSERPLGSALLPSEGQKTGSSEQWAPKDNTIGLSTIVASLILSAFLATGLTFMMNQTPDQLTTFQRDWNTPQTHVEGLVAQLEELLKAPPGAELAEEQEAPSGSKGASFNSNDSLAPPERTNESKNVARLSEAPKAESGGVPVPTPDNMEMLGQVLGMVGSPQRNDTRLAQPLIREEPTSVPLDLDNLAPIPVLPMPLETTSSDEAPEMIAPERTSVQPDEEIMQPIAEERPPAPLRVVIEEEAGQLKEALEDKKKISSSGSDEMQDGSTTELPDEAVLQEDISGEVEGGDLFEDPDNIQARLLASVSQASNPQDMLAHLARLNDRIASGQLLTPSMVDGLPEDIVKEFYANGAVDVDAVEEEELTTLARNVIPRDRYGIPTIPRQNMWVYHNGRVRLPLPGGGSIEHPDDMKDFGLEP